MKYEIKMKLPSLNDYIKICRANKYAANAEKQEIEREIMWHIIKMPRFTYPIRINFEWVEANEKRDYDNIAFAKKFILDAMVKSGKLKDDNRRFVKGFSDSFSLGKEYKVILTIEKAE